MRSPPASRLWAHSGPVRDLARPQNTAASWALIRWKRRASGSCPVHAGGQQRASLAGRPMLGVVRAGLATAKVENVLAGGGRYVVVSRLRITEAGRRVLAEQQG
jgi:hypothetical protein